MRKMQSDKSQETKTGKTPSTTFKRKVSCISPNSSKDKLVEKKKLNKTCVSSVKEQKATYDKSNSNHSNESFLSKSKQSPFKNSELKLVENQADKTNITLPSTSKTSNNATPESNLIDNHAENISISNIPVCNMFEALSDMDEDESGPQPVPAHRPPPIIVEGITDFHMLYNDLINLVGKANFQFMSKRHKITIKTKTSDAYRLCVKYFEDKKFEFHTYQSKEEKAFRVVIRNLYYSTPPDLIRADLEELGFKVRYISNARDPRTKKPLDLFFVDLEPGPNNKEVFDINFLVQSEVKVEEPYKKREIVQCLRCQQYLHTRAFCHHTPRCVKCGQDHPSDKCLKSRDVPAVCALCGENHPANYRGCTVHRELQRRRLRIQNEGKPKNWVQNRHFKMNEVADHLTPETELDNTTLTEHRPRPRIEQYMTYAEATRPHTRPRYDTHSYAQHSAQHNTPSYTQSAPHNTHNTQDIASHFTSFINEFKNMISPLIALLSKLITRLIPDGCP